MTTENRGIVEAAKTLMWTGGDDDAVKAMSGMTDELFAVACEEWEQEAEVIRQLGQDGKRITSAVKLRPDSPKELLEELMTEGKKRAAKASPEPVKREKGAATSVVCLLAGGQWSQAYADTLPERGLNPVNYWPDNQGLDGLPECAEKAGAKVVACYLNQLGHTLDEVIATVDRLQADHDLNVYLMDWHGYLNAEQPNLNPMDILKAASTLKPAPKAKRERAEFTLEQKIEIGERMAAKANGDNSTTLAKVYGCTPKTVLNCLAQLDDNKAKLAANTQQ